MKSLEAKNLSVRIDNYEVLSDINLSIDHPTFSVIMGPNGAGKTTLLKTMLGVLRPFNGWIKVLGMDPSADSNKLRQMIGYVPQREKTSFFIPMKVKEVVAMPLLIRKDPPRWLSSKDLETVRVALESVNLKGVEDKRFGELSWGQRQKVFIARAIVSNPSMLLLDEPLNGIDIESQDEIVDFLSRLKKKGVSIFMVMHDLDDIIHLVDNIILLHRRLIAYGSPSDVLREEVLKKVYGERIRMYSREPCMIFMPRDVHG